MFNFSFNSQVDHCWEGRGGVSGVKKIIHGHKRPINVRALLIGCSSLKLLKGCVSPLDLCTPQGRPCSQLRQLEPPPSHINARVVGDAAPLIRLFNMYNNAHLLVRLDRDSPVHHRETTLKRKIPFDPCLPSRLPSSGL